MVPATKVNVPNREGQVQNFGARFPPPPHWVPLVDSKEDLNPEMDNFPRETSGIKQPTFGSNKNEPRPHGVPANDRTLWCTKTYSLILLHIYPPVQPRNPPEKVHVGPEGSQS